MQKSLLRIVSIIVLLGVVQMFTGLLATVSASPFEDDEKSCYDKCNKDDEQSSDHCSTPDCPMFLCLSVNVVSPFIPSNLSGSVYIPQFIAKLHLKSPIMSIYHPPAIS